MLFGLRSILEDGGRESVAAASRRWRRFPVPGSAAGHGADNQKWLKPAQDRFG